MDYINNRNELLRLLRKNVNEEKFLHSLGVEKVAKLLANKYGADENKAGFAGILHDITKCFDNVAMAREYGIENYISKKTLHAYTAAIYIKKNGITQDQDIINAVKYHTTGRENMSMLEKIVYLADIIEPNRDASMIDLVKPLCFSDLDKAMLLCCKLSIKLLLKRNSPIDLNTIMAYNYYSGIKDDLKTNILAEDKEWIFPKNQNK